MLSYLSNKPFVIEGRNWYDPEVTAAEGFTIYSVGCAASHLDGVRVELLEDGKKA